MDATTSMNTQMDEELLLVKSQIFEINQQMAKIVEQKDAPYIDYISQVMDVKLNAAIPKINAVMNTKLNPLVTKFTQLVNVKSSEDTSQQGGEGAEKEAKNVNKEDGP